MVGLENYFTSSATWSIKRSRCDDDEDDKEWMEKLTDRCADVEGPRIKKDVPRLDLDQVRKGRE